MSEHTPGPWEVRAETIGNGMLHITSPSYRAECDANHVVCEVRSWVRPDPAANARLICAAPDLFHACRAVSSDLHRLLDGDDFCGMSDTELFTAFLTVLEPALDKAEGRSDE